MIGLLRNYLTVQCSLSYRHVCGDTVISSARSLLQGHHDIFSVRRKQLQINHWRLTNSASSPKEDRMAGQEAHPARQEAFAEASSDARTKLVQVSLLPGRDEGHTFPT